jgi:hypothetical protein
MTKVAIGQFSIATALAFYFGWARTTAYYRYFGLETSMIGLSTADYVLRSTGALYWPVMGLGLLAVLALTVHPRIVTLLHRAPRGSATWILGFTAWVMIAVAAASFLSATIGHASWGTRAIPWLLTGGALLLAYHSAVTPARAGRRSRSSIQQVALLGVAFGGLFWLVGNYAGYVGVSNAREDAGRIAYRTDVAVYSAQQLALGGRAGIREDVSSGEGAYHFRYTDLRLLAFSDGHYFLLPLGWRHNGRDPLVIISESDTLRVELIGSPYT